MIIHHRDDRLRCRIEGVRIGTIGVLPFLAGLDMDSKFNLNDTCGHQPDLMDFKLMYHLKTGDSFWGPAVHRIEREGDCLWFIAPLLEVHMPLMLIGVSLWSPINQVIHTAPMNTPRPSQRGDYLNSQYKFRLPANYIKDGTTDVENWQEWTKQVPKLAPFWESALWTMLIER